MTTAPTAQVSAASAWRPRALARLADEAFDLLVIGAGATGAAVARDAATRGLKVAVLDHGDIAGQTSSRSSKLIHGGLRYLQYGDLRLVFEALSERRVLLETAPHLCWPVEFVFPTYRGRTPSFFVLGAGIRLYDALALWRAPTATSRRSAHELFRLAPWLRAAGLTGGWSYTDCQTDDARLVLAQALDAESAGAVLAPYVSAVAALRDAGGRVRGARVRDRIRGDVFDVRATAVVAAAGPFSDAFEGTARPRMRPTLGVHVVLDADRLPTMGRAFVINSPRDGRLMFVLPAGARTVVGTTDTDFHRAGGPGPPRVDDAIAADASDVAYILEAANHAFPPARLGPDDVLATFAGLRPLVASGAASASATSREHDILLEPGGWLRVIGGKLTTTRRMAEEVVDRAVELLSTRGFEGKIEPSSTRERPLPGSLREDQVRLVARADAALAERIEPDLPYTWAEVILAARDERVTTLVDILARRVPLLTQARDQGLGASARAAVMAGAVLGWDGARVKAELDEYTHAVDASRRWRKAPL